MDILKDSMDILENNMDKLRIILEIIGTISFAASGTLTGIKKNMDIFGVTVLGLVTAFGGGIVRDVILDKNPPVIFTNPVFDFPLYPIIAVVTSIALFLPFIRRPLLNNHHAYEITMLVMDSIGLGIFTVIGVETTYRFSDESSFFLIVTMGMLSGVGGGVIRDVLAGDRPYIFVKHVYALASLMGSVVCALLWKKDQQTALVVGAVLTVIIRFLAAHFRWSLPKSHVGKSEIL